MASKTRTEPTVLSPDLPLPIEGMNVEIKYAKAGKIVYWAILLIGSPICLFGIKSWFAFIALLLFLSWNYWKIWPYFKAPLIIIDMQGINAKDKFYSWNDIKSTHILITNNDPNEYELVLISNYPYTHEIEIGIGGLDHNVKEISHYTEYFRQKASNSTH